MKKVVCFLAFIFTGSLPALAAQPSAGIVPWQNRRPDSTPTGKARKARLYDSIKISPNPIIKSKNGLKDFFNDKKNLSAIAEEPLIEPSAELQQFIDDLVADDIWDFQKTPMPLQVIGRIFHRLYLQWPANAQSRIKRNILSEEFQRLLADIQANLAEQEEDDLLFDLNTLVEDDLRIFIQVFMQTYYPGRPVQQWHVNLASNLFKIWQAENQIAIFENFVKAENTKKRNKALQILGLPANATLAEIKTRYRQLALQHHPDKGGNAEIFKRINNAYALLNPQ